MGAHKISQPIQRTRRKPPIHCEVRQVQLHRLFSQVFRVDPFPGEIPVIPQIVFHPTQVARFGGHCEVHGATGDDEWIEEFHAEHPIGINPLYRRTVIPQVLKLENISFDLPNRDG